jgi:predicted PhzF superfamily epimerase YddE/YHI9
MPKIKNSDLLENYEIQIVSTGHSKVMVGIKSIEVEVKIEDKEPVEIEVSGSAVIVFQSEITI